MFNNFPLFLDKKKSPTRQGPGAEPARSGPGEVVLPLPTSPAPLVWHFMYQFSNEYTSATCINSRFLALAYPYMLQAEEYSSLLVVQSL